MRVSEGRFYGLSCSGMVIIIDHALALYLFIYMSIHLFITFMSCILYSAFEAA